MRLDSFKLSSTFAAVALLCTTTAVQAGDKAPAPLQYREEGTYDPALLAKPAPSNNKRPAGPEHRAEGTYDAVMPNQPSPQASAPQTDAPQLPRTRSSGEPTSSRNTSHDLKLHVIPPHRPTGEYGRGYLTRFGHWNPPRYSPFVGRH
jgi:hypothetical protein